MTTIATRNQVEQADIRYQVIAITEPQLLAELRNALRAHEPLSVVVSQAVTWDPELPELMYRANRCTLDRPVARVEVACSSIQVEAVMNAMRRALKLDTRNQPGVNSLTVVPVRTRLEAGDTDPRASARGHGVGSSWGVPMTT